MALNISSPASNTTLFLPHLEGKEVVSLPSDVAEKIIQFSGAHCEIVMNSVGGFTSYVATHEEASRIRSILPYLFPLENPLFSETSSHQKVQRAISQELSKVDVEQKTIKLLVFLFHCGINAFIKTLRQGHTPTRFELSLVKVINSISKKEENSHAIAQVCVRYLYLVALGSRRFSRETLKTTFLQSDPFIALIDYLKCEEMTGEKVLDLTRAIRHDFEAIRVIQKAIAYQNMTSVLRESEYSDDPQRFPGTCKREISIHPLDPIYKLLFYLEDQLPPEGVLTLIEKLNTHLKKNYPSQINLPSCRSGLDAAPKETWDAFYPSLKILICEFDQYQSVLTEYEKAALERYLWMEFPNWNQNAELKTNDLFTNSTRLISAIFDVYTSRTVPPRYKIVHLPSTKTGHKGVAVAKELEPGALIELDSSCPHRFKLFRDPTIEKACAYQLNYTQNVIDLYLNIDKKKCKLIQLNKETVIAKRAINALGDSLEAAENRIRLHKDIILPLTRKASSLIQKIKKKETQLSQLLKERPKNPILTTEK